MALVSVETVRRWLRRQPEERVVAFVSALWGARGVETRVVDGTDLVVTEGAGASERLRVVVGSRIPNTTAGVDVLVLARPASAVAGTAGFEGRIVDADDIHAMLLYAVPRTAADDLCRRFFDRPLETDPDAETAPVVGRATEHSASLVVGLVGLSLLVAGVFGGPLLYGGTTPVFGAPDSVGADPVADAETPTVSPTRTTRDEPSVSASTYPPGLGADGILDHDALADAHATTVTGQSYRLTITHREYVEGAPTAYRRETVYVAEPTVYRTELEGAGQLERGPLVIAGVEAYADGETRSQRRIVADEFDRTYTVRTSPVRGVRNGEGRYADRVEQYLGWFLSVSESELVDVVEREGTRYYWVRLGEDPYPGIENSTGSVLVDENGVVHEITRRYDYPGESGVSAVVSIRYTDIGTTTVSPPEWYDGDEESTVSTVEGTPEPEPSVTTGTNATGTNATAGADEPARTNATTTRTSEATPTRESDSSTATRTATPT